MRIETNISLSQYNTFGIDVTAERLLHIHSLNDAQEAISNGLFQTENPPLILGGGSNMVLLDTCASVVRMGIKGKTILDENSETVLVEFGAGEIWHECVEWAVNNGWGGIENLALIPGTIGAAPIQNIGAYGSELVDSFYSAIAIDIQTNTLKEFFLSECEFGYRNSIFKNQLKGKVLITAVKLLLKKNPVVNLNYKDVQQELAIRAISDPTIDDIFSSVVAIRQRKLPDPAVIGNAGSFFKNPIITKNIVEKIRHHYPNVPTYLLDDGTYKIPAGWLIEQCGLKGKRFGTVGVHANQALVLINYGGASGKEIYELAQQIQEKVAHEFGITIEMEVNIIGHLPE